ncbi:DUF362 domain-containing protein [Desulfospira joergensenii]|uniref:DUF362 domain-containing protein n=1 Tax=Desulfospira joergensenii TaxID=53329 RepID=UPI0003B42A71|nr:DUF362 domain-containing protein [Desulfospira joergensenii]
MLKTVNIMEIEFKSYAESVPELLDRIRAGKGLQKQKTLLLKPNLVNASPFPVTTSPELCRAVIEYVRRHTRARLIIGEGCGDDVMETPEVFATLGYDRLARELDVELMDLNHAPLVRLENRENEIFPEIYLPEIAFESYVISLPVLKAHSLAVMTGTLKNMMGFAPPQHYSGGGFWKKAFFHARMHQSIRELNRFLVPDLTLMDASVGLCQYHLGGPECSPPLNRLMAGMDPFEIDRAGARLLGLDPQRIPHILPA